MVNKIILESFEVGALLTSMDIDYLLKTCQCYVHAVL